MIDMTNQAEDAMTPIFLIAGSPGVGKSTIGGALAGKFPKGMHIPLDTIRHMVVSGRLGPSLDVWSEGFIEQLEAARASMCAMALRYRSVGFAVTIDDIWDRYNRLTEYYPELLAMPDTHKILLYPSEETAMVRNVGRYGPGERADILNRAIHYIYADLRTSAAILKEEGWIVVDSTEQSVEETVAEILERTGNRSV
jgi:adenylate kinase family enzyme